MLQEDDALPRATDPPCQHFILKNSLFSDSGEDAKEKGTRKVGGARKRKNEGRESL